MTTWANDDKNTSNYTYENRSDYVAGSAARFSTARFGKSRFSKKDDFNFYEYDQKHNSIYTNDTKN